MIKNSSTKKYLIVSASLFFILLIVSVFVIFIINKEKENVKKISNDLSIASREDVVTLKRVIRDYEESADSVQNLLVDKDEVFHFISQVEELAENSGTTIGIQNIDLFDVLRNDEMVRSSGQESPERTHGKFVMSLKADGSWDDVFDFLLKMENFPKHTNIESLRLNYSNDSESERSFWSANFDIVTTTN